MTINQLILIGLFILLGSGLQSAVGFGYGLFAVPLIVWVGVPLPVSVTLVLVTTFFQMGWGCWQLRADLAWRPAMPILVMRLTMLPVGVWLLGLLAAAEPGEVKQWVGVILLVVIGVQCFARIEPRPRVHPGWSVLAGGGSGLLGGLVGMGGPPIVLWLMAHDWPVRQTRSFLWLTVVLLLPVNIALLWWRFGDPVSEALLLALAFVPVALVGTVVGLWAGGRLSRPRLRRASIVLLTSIAVVSIVEPWLATTSAS